MVKDKIRPILESSDIGKPVWEDYQSRMEGIIRNVTIKLALQTWDGNLNTMHVIFPRHRRRGSPYLGGAHGTLGVAYVILMACMQVPGIIESDPTMLLRL